MFSLTSGGAIVMPVTPTVSFTTRFRTVGCYAPLLSKLPQKKQQRVPATSLPTPQLPTGLVLFPSPAVDDPTTPELKHSL
jgi:hypothetical protein